MSLRPFRTVRASTSLAFCGVGPMCAVRRRSAAAPKQRDIHQRHWRWPLLRAGQMHLSFNGREETAEQAMERRLRESQQYDDRVWLVFNKDAWEQALVDAGDNLIVLEVQSEVLCETGIDDDEEPTSRHDADEAQRQAMQRCSEIKHTFQRIARDCNDATFLTHMVDEDPSPESLALCDHLGIEVLPTLQFWREGKKLWEHRGALHMDNELADGEFKVVYIVRVRYYQAQGSAGAQEFVRELKDQAQFESFIKDGDDNVLKVVNVALTSSAACKHVYPAVLALAKNFVGFASFGRIMGDSSNAMRGVMRKYKVTEVPTFLFFRGGREVGRHVGSSRADLICQILEVQHSLGISPPPKPPAGGIPLSRELTSR